MADPLCSKYQGEVGSRYFHGRFASADAPSVLGRINAAKFLPHVKETDRVLDFGAGTGDLLANVRCSERVALEINEEAVALCRANHPEIAIVSSLDSIRDQFDVVISHHCIEHLASPFQALLDVRKVLVPGGRLVACVPLDDWRLRRNRSWRADDQIRHLYTWTPLAFGHLLTEAGFHVHEVKINCFSTPGRYSVALDKVLPPWAMKAICAATAVIRRRREVIALCSAPG